jgi:hypothetical protein
METIIGGVILTVTVNDTELPAITAFSSERSFQGAARKTLEFHFSSNATTFEQINALFGNVTGSITITDNDGTYQHDDYALRISTALQNVVITPENGTDPAVTEERFVVVVAQKTYAEKQMEAMKEQSDITYNAFIDFCTNALPNILGSGV